MSYLMIVMKYRSMIAIDGERLAKCISKVFKITACQEVRVTRHTMAFHSHVRRDAVANSLRIKEGDTDVSGEEIGVAITRTTELVSEIMKEFDPDVSCCHLELPTSI